jgi:hypothetical protein
MEETNPFPGSARYSKKRTQFFLARIGGTRLEVASTVEHTSASLDFVAGGRGFADLSPCVPATSRLEPHQSESIGHAGWRGLVLNALDALVLWYPRVLDADVTESIRRSSGRRISGSAPCRKSSTAVMRRPLRREITVRKRRGVQRLPGCSRTRASGSAGRRVAQDTDNRTPKDF